MTTEFPPATPVDQARALEIIAAYGADARRWPSSEREAVLALLASDAAVAVAQAEAQGMDALLAGWAGDVTPRSFDAAALIPVPAASGIARSRLMRAPRGWLAGGALAAALAAVLVLTPLGLGNAPEPLAPQTEIASNSLLGSASAEGGSVVSNDEGFAFVFTPTADEEDLI